ncbi:MAG: hypothetical protein ACLTDI_13430 [Acutalibacteraceae bacterium]
MTKGLKFNFSMHFQSVIAIFYDTALPRDGPKRHRLPHRTAAAKSRHSYSRALTTASADRSSTCMVRIGFIDMLQIMGIRIADNPALLQIRIITLQLMQFLQIPDLRCLKTAVRRIKPRFAIRLLAALSTWAGNMTPS